MQAIQDFFFFEQQDVTSFAHQFCDQNEVSDRPGVHPFLQSDADHPFIRLLGYIGYPCSHDVFTQIGAEAGGYQGIGVFFFRQVQAMEVGMGGEEKLFLSSMPAHPEKEVRTVHLVDLGDERTNDLALQLLHDPVNDKKVHRSPVIISF
jgi:hypothetical protein